MFLVIIWPRNSPQNSREIFGIPQKLRLSSFHSLVSSLYNWVGNVIPLYNPTNRLGPFFFHCLRWDIPTRRSSFVLGTSFRLFEVAVSHVSTRLKHQGAGLQKNPMGKNPPSKKRVDFFLGKKNEENFKPGTWHLTKCLYSGSLVSFTRFSCKDVVHHPIETTDKQNGCSRRFVVYCHHPNVLHRTGIFTYMWGIKRWSNVSTPLEIQQVGTQIQGGVAGSNDFPLQFWVIF